jgi:serine/threonine-protein kinase RsbT
MSLSTDKSTDKRGADLGPGRPDNGTVLAIRGEADLLPVRSALRTEAGAAGLGLTAATKLVTAGSELARNIVRYANDARGSVTIEPLVDGNRKGVRAVFRDDGPGIADVDAAMRDGYSTAGSLGLGLPGSRRLVDDFQLDSEPGRGTTVVIVQWQR